MIYINHVHPIHMPETWPKQDVYPMPCATRSKAQDFSVGRGNILKFPISEEMVRERARHERPPIGLGDDEISILSRVSQALAANHRQDFSSIETFCMFIGYPRSGHSLVASFLDAHENAVIAHELDVLNLLGRGFDREQIFYLLLKNAELMGAIGRQWGPYSYSVPGLWQGRHGRLLVIGDKKGGKSSLRLSVQPDLLDRLQEVVGWAPRIIHVVRNPFDNILTISRKHYQGDVNQAIHHYGAICATNEGVLNKRARDALTVFYEDFLVSPRDALAGICDFLGLPISQAFIDGCEKIIQPPVGSARRPEQFDKLQVIGVERLIERYSFLQRYRA